MSAASPINRPWRIERGSLGDFLYDSTADCLGVVEGCGPAVATAINYHDRMRVLIEAVLARLDMEALRLGENEVFPGSAFRSDLRAIVDELKALDKQK